MLRIMNSVLLLAVLAAPLSAEDAKKPDKKKPSDPNVVQIFDGKTLKGWKQTEFGGEGDSYVKDGQIILELGSNLTGITFENAKILPKSNYEITLEAQRVNGGDFFCGLTTPYRDSFFSLILGGWGGGVCGISSLDGADASENETTSYREFKNGQWYKIRLRVTDDRIDAWLDGKQIIEVEDLKMRRVTTRIEVDLSQPLGFSSWQTTAALRNLKLRKLTEKELTEVAKKADE